MIAQKYFSWCLILTVSLLNIKPVYLIPQCPINECYNAAASKCTAEPTCQNPAPFAEHGCIEDYCEQRCECSEGYIRDETKNGKCVPLSECPCEAQCPVNEWYNTAALKCTPEPTCQNRTPNAKHGCVEDNCQQRCECIEGYIRDETKYGKCVPLSECPCTVCGENEVFNECASSCDIEPTCDNQTPVKDPCCEPKSIQRCECAPGYVRDPNGKCICTTSCPHCDPLTENLCCKPCCEVTCQHPEGWNCRKDCCADVCELGCVCKDHYTRDEKTGKCVAVCYHDLIKKPAPHHPHPHPHPHHHLGQHIIL